LLSRALTCGLRPTMRLRQAPPKYLEGRACADEQGVSVRGRTVPRTVHKRSQRELRALASLGLCCGKWGAWPAAGPEPGPAGVLGVGGRVGC
jgi:hypothetical protein